MKCGKGAVPGAQEPVRGAVYVCIHSQDRSIRGDANGVGGRERAGCASVGGIERSEGAVFGPHERVAHEVSVIVISRDIPWRIDVGGKGADHAGHCARGIERGDSTVFGPHEPVTYKVYVIVRSRDSAFGVDAGGSSEATSRSGDIERDEGTAAVPQESVTHGVCVIVVSRDRPRLDDLWWHR